MKKNAANKRAPTTPTTVNTPATAPLLEKKELEWVCGVVAGELVAVETADDLYMVSPTAVVVEVDVDKEEVGVDVDVEGDWAVENVVITLSCVIVRVCWEFVTVRIETITEGCTGVGVGVEEGVGDGVDIGVDEGVGDGVDKGVGDGVDEGVGDGVDEGVDIGVDEGVWDSEAWDDSCEGSELLTE